MAVHRVDGLLMHHHGGMRWQLLRTDWLICYMNDGKACVGGSSPKNHAMAPLMPTLLDVATRSGVEGYAGSSVHQLMVTFNPRRSAPINGHSLLQTPDL